MTLKIDISQMADIATQNNVVGTGEAIEAIENAVDNLALRVARHFDIQSMGSDHQPMEFGGVLVSFGPNRPGQECPEPIRDADPSGDWE